MRMWGVNPDKMCRAHLLGEHVEMHMFVGTINKNISIQGYLDKDLVDPSKIKERHDLLVKEMKKRGYNHASPLPDILTSHAKNILNIKNNELELKRRCGECRF